MAKFYDRAWVSTTTLGTGTVTLGTAVTGYFTFAEAGVANADVVSYVIEDGDDFEYGIGTYTSAGTTLTRTTVTGSKIAGVAGTTKITLSGNARVFITARRLDLLSISETQTTNKVFAGPASGGAAAPTFRDLVAADFGIAIAQNAFLAGPSSGGAAAAAFRAITAADIATASPVSSFTTLTAGTAATYNTPAGARQLRIRMAGPGGGGGATDTNAGANGSGATSFNDWTADFGRGGTVGGSGGSGGSGGTDGTGTLIKRFAGQNGRSGYGIASSTSNAVGGDGGDTPFFGGGSQGTSQNITGGSGVANSGGGGAGGARDNFRSSGGGGSGEFVEFIINSPSASYLYTIGTGGAGGVGGTGGGAGGSGGIIVEAIF